MSDSFEFTLHSPLTKEDWNKLSDAELENTMSVTFQTPQGKQVKYIKSEILDKIRADVINIADSRRSIPVRSVINIIDKFKVETGDKE